MGSTRVDPDFFPYVGKRVSGQSPCRLNDLIGLTGPPSGPSKARAQMGGKIRWTVLSLPDATSKPRVNVNST